MHGEAKQPVLDQHTQLVETGHQAIIHWDEFSIANGEITRFMMPDSHSIVLNRVMGGPLSLISGSLEANGKVILVNPQGVMVGKDAFINVASLIASSLDVLDAEFLKGGDLHFFGDSDGSIVNLGKVAAWDGDVILMGSRVENSGHIEAPGGLVALAAGGAIRIAGDVVEIQKELEKSGNPYQYAIQDGRPVDAKRVEERGGRRFLVRMDEEGTISTSGEKGGGQVSVRGESIYLGPNSHIEADATVSGNGGNVIVWGDEKTSFLGSISARGGREGGDGGMIEVSSPGELEYQGLANTLAPKGKTGTLLLDPVSVMITTNPDMNNTFTASCPISYDFNGFTAAVVNTATLSANLNLCNVTINASQGSTATVGQGTITVQDALTWSAPTTLTLVATDNNGGDSFVVINNIVTMNSGGSIEISTNKLIIGQAPLGPIGIIGSTGSVVTLNVASIEINGAGFDAFIQGASNANFNVTGAVQLNAAQGSVMTPTAQNAFLSVTGDLNLLCGNLSLIGGANNMATEQAAYIQAGGTVAIDGTASSSPTIIIGQVAMLDSASIVGGTVSIGQIDTVLHPQVVKLLGGSGTATTSNAFIQATNGDLAISILNTSTTGVLLYGGNSSVTGFSDAFIQGAHKIKIDAGNGPIGLNGGTNTNQQAFIESTSTGDMLLTAVGVNLVAGGPSGAAVSIVATDGNISITSSDAVKLIGGGPGSSAYMQTLGGGNTIDIRSNGLILNSGASPGANAKLSSSGNISIDGLDATHSNAVSLVASGDAVSIFTTGTGSILIGQKAPLFQIPTALTLQGGLGSTSSAVIMTSATGSGNILANLSGPIVLTGGSGASSQALIQTFGSGFISLTSLGSTLNGGSSGTPDGSDALIITNGAGNVAIDTGSMPLNLTGGTSANQMAMIQSGFSNLTVTAGAVNLTGIGSNSTAVLQADLALSISSPGAVTLAGGGMTGASAKAIAGTAIDIQSVGLFLTSGTASMSTAKVDSTLGVISIDGFSSTQSGAIVLTASGDTASITSAGNINIGQTIGKKIPTGLTCVGSSITSADATIVTQGSGHIAASMSGLFSLTGNVGNASLFTVSGGNVSCQVGGDAVITAGIMGSAGIFAPTAGEISLQCNNFSLIGGTNSSQAAITTAMGDISIVCLGDANTTAANMGSPALIQTMGSNLTMNVAGNATFSGFTTVSTPAGSPGDLLIIAGKNLFILPDAAVAAEGTSPSSLTLVCDNDFPHPHGIGPGEFQLLTGGTITASVGTPIRIFTAKREQNLITTSINGNAFIPGPEFENSATEEWGVYYFNSFGGDPFTIFYKNTNIVPQPVTPALFQSAFLTSQWFFDVGEFDQFVYFDWYGWSDFETSEKTKKPPWIRGNERIVNQTGHSLRRRGGEFLKDVNLRGFPLL